MQNSLHRHARWWPGTSLAIVAFLMGSGCPSQPAGETASSSGQQASESIPVSPGEFITVADPSIRAGDLVTIEFSSANGYYSTIEARSEQDGSVRVPVPPLMDALATTFNAGDMNVAIKGAAPLMKLAVSDLPVAEDGTAPGAVFRLVLEETIEQYRYQLAGITAVQADIGGEFDAGSLVAAINAQIATLQNMIAGYDATGHFTLPDPRGDVELTQEQMVLADRLLAAIFVGMADEMIAASETTPTSKLMRPKKAGVTSWQQEFLNRVRTGIADVKSHLRQGLGGANLLASAVGLGGAVVCAVGIVASSPGVIAVGAVIGVAGAVVAFAQGAAGGENSDAFLNRDPKRFSTSVEAGSQIVRYGTNAVSAIPGPVGGTATAVGLGTAGWDFYNSASTFKCQGKRPTRRRAVHLAAFEVDLQTFCEGIGLPPGDSTGDGNDTSSPPGGTGETTEPGTPPATPPTPPEVPPALAECPPPDGAAHYADYSGGTGTHFLEWYIGPDRLLVGPSMAWYSAARTQLYYLECYAPGGLRQGWSRSWYPSGALVTETMYAGGVKNGVSRYYLENGQVDNETHYLNGKVDGMYTRWYPDGVKMSEYSYQQDVLTGPWKTWYSTGIQSGEGEYLNNVIYGLVRYWYASGQIRNEMGRDEEGRLHGVFRKWDETGKLMDDCTYDHGVVVSCKVWNGTVYH